MSFIQNYIQLKEEFRNTNNLVEINNLNLQKIVWPQSSGVYTIWKENCQSPSNLIYIGISGKFVRGTEGNLIINNGSFHHRANRWTPYRFCEHQLDGRFRYHFRFGPICTNVKDQYDIRFNEDAYTYAIPYTLLAIDCFLINETNLQYSPSLLEKELLTKYMKETGDLPLANNEL